MVCDVTCGEEMASGGHDWIVLCTHARVKSVLLTGQSVRHTRDSFASTGGGAITPRIMGQMGGQFFAVVGRKGWPLAA